MTKVALSDFMESKCVELCGKNADDIQRFMLDTIYIPLEKIRDGVYKSTVSYLSCDEVEEKETLLKMITGKKYDISKDKDGYWWVKKYEIL